MALLKKKGNRIFRRGDPQGAEGQGGGDFAAVVGSGHAKCRAGLGSGQAN